jgi:hypothetical protein
LSLLTMMEFSKGSSGELRLEKRDPTFDNFDGIDFVLQTLVVDDRLITLYPAVVRPIVRPSVRSLSINPSICLSASPSICPFVSPPVRPSVSQSVRPSIHSRPSIALLFLPICMSVFLKIEASVCPSICSPVVLSVPPPSCRSVCPSAISQFFCLSNYLLFTHPSTCPSVETSQATLSVHLTVFKSNSEENRSYTTMKSNVV